MSVRWIPIVAVLAGTFAAMSCTCGCQNTGNRPQDGSPPDARSDKNVACEGMRDSTHDTRRDRIVKDHGRVERTLWPRDYGPLLDVNLASCTTGDGPRAVDLSTPVDGGAIGAVAWQTQLLSATAAAFTAAIASRGSNVYFSFLHYGFAATQGDTGAVLWTHPTPTEGTSMFQSIHALSDGLVYVQGIDGFVGKRSYADGNILWRFTMPGPFDPSVAQYGRVARPVVALDDESLVATGTSLSLRRLSIDGMTSQWSVPLHGHPLGDNIVADAARIYVGLDLSSRVAAYALDGKAIWERKAKGYSARVVLGANNSVIATSSILDDKGSQVVATQVASYDRAFGKVLWEMTFEGALGTSSATRVGRNGRIVTMTSKTGAFMRLHGIGPDGQDVWTHELDNLLTPGAPASNFESMGPIGADGQLYTLRCRPTMTSFQTRMQMFDVETGSLKQDIPIGVPGCPAQPAAVLLSSGILVTTMWAGANQPVYAVGLRTRSPGLAKGPWPTQYGNNERTSNTCD